MNDTQSDILDLVELLLNKIQKDEVELTTGLQYCKARLVSSIETTVSEYRPSTPVSAQIRACKNCGWHQFGEKIYSEEATATYCSFEESGSSFPVSGELRQGVGSRDENQTDVDVSVGLCYRMG